MSYKSPAIHSRQSMLGRAAYSSISPIPAYSAAFPRYKYLPYVSNQTQSIMKEMYTTEQRIQKNWEINTSAMSHKFAKKQNQSFGQKEIKNTVNYVRSNPIELSSSLNNPQEHLKTNIRNRSYDPILGRSNMYDTPPTHQRVFGTNAADFHAKNAFYRNY